MCRGGGGGGEVAGIWMESQGNFNLADPRGEGYRDNFGVLKLRDLCKNCVFHLSLWLPPPPPNWITHSRSRRGRRTSRSGLGDLHGVRTTVGNFMERLGTYLG